MNTKTIAIRNIILGSGRPKICLPIVGKTIEEICSQSEIIMQKPVDIVEWRADLFALATDSFATIKAIQAIRRIIGETPLLYTIRTAKEGGGISIPFDEYAALLLQAGQNALIDAVDIEILSGKEKDVTNLISSIKQSATVIASSHDFTCTPAKEEIIRRLCYMESCGADICKMAVMPKDTEDVLTLLTATNEAYKQISRPIITMSMGKQGLVSRLCGEVFGSALTFGCVGQSSAPGQIDAEELNTVLQIIHKNTEQ